MIYGIRKNFTYRKFSKSKVFLKLILISDMKKRSNIVMSFPLLNFCRKWRERAGMREKH